MILERFRQQLHERFTNTIIVARLDNFQRATEVLTKNYADLIEIPRMTYPLKFRHKVLSLRAREGLTIAQLAARFDIGVASVVRWLKSPVPRTTRNNKAIKIDRAIVTIDESGFASDMARTHGDAVKGRRCFGTHAFGARGRSNVIGALLAGVLLSPLRCDFNINSDIFHAWISDALIPNLPPAAVLVMEIPAFTSVVTPNRQFRLQGRFWNISRPTVAILIRSNINGRKQSRS